MCVHHWFADALQLADCLASVGCSADIQITIGDHAAASDYYLYPNIADLS